MSSRTGPFVARHCTAIVFAIALAAAAMLLIAYASAIATLDFPDSDDQLRLLEVRDWMAGQSFFDVTQYRMTAPIGAPMHWSRLVDLPIAGLILLFRPVLGAAGAELAAATIIPLALLVAALLLVARIARRLGGAETGIAACLLAATTFGVILQFRPLRVDHHGWQVVLALVAVAALLRPAARATGIIAALALAVALQISLETLPFAIVCGGLVALRWAWRADAANRDRLVGFVGTLAVAEALLFVALHRDLGGYCDAVAPAHLLALAIVAIGVAALAWRAPRSGPVRLGALGIVAVAAAAGFRAIPPHCGLDAFSGLEPIVRRYWLDQVAEGLPIWRQDRLVAAFSIGFPLTGLIATGLAIHAERRAIWVDHLVLLGGATAVALLVQRAEALANFLAASPAAWLLLRLLVRAQAGRTAIVRVVGSLAALFALSPWAAAAIVNLLPHHAPPPVEGPSADAACHTASGVRTLRRLPTARMLAPLDLGVTILLQTDHAILAGVYHRDHAAIADELRAYIGSDDHAQAVMRRYGLRYLVDCPSFPEMTLYRTIAPNGFAAHIEIGRVPDWLTPVPLPGSPIRVWRIMP